MLQRKDRITEKKTVRSRETSGAWAVWAAARCVSDGAALLPVICGLFITTGLQAQYLPQHMTLNAGEEVTYDVYFKWGILMPRAGEGRLTFNPAVYGHTSASLYRMTFQTSKFFDSVYKMRDTIECYYAPDYALLHSSKRTDEGGYYLTDELTFSYDSQTQTRVHSRRYTPQAVKIDTVIPVTREYVFDMLGAVFFLRTLDRRQLKPDVTFPATVISGRDLVRISYRYTGEATLELAGRHYQAHHFFIDIHDRAFTQSKSAAEVWVGNDGNALPLKVRSKLRVGYAEIHYKSSARLKVSPAGQTKAGQNSPE
ncbi:MAG: DUF3108 domain-containing protein [Tannerella sp.]|jgi:hypothetical protein|nr:DUF3108 domain-containing protein [Tannerella sp.]